MSVQLSGEIVGLDEASKQLDEMIAADQGQPGHTSPEQRAAEEAAAAAKAGTAGKEGAQTAAQPGTDAQGKANNDDSKPAAPAANAAEGKGKGENTQLPKDPKGEEGKAGEKTGDQKSRYAKAQERLQGSWQELNASKAAAIAERDAWQKERDAEKAELQRQREEFERERSNAERQHSPEDYEAAAKKFEADGKLDLADLARETAQKLRANPPAKPGAKQEAAQKEWALKAGKDFPDLAKDNSPLQVRVAQLLKEEAEFKSHPKGIYVAARIASLEAQAAESKALKDTVAAKDKELETLRAKVTELEGLTAPGGGNGRTALPGAKSFEDMSDEEQLQVLTRQAAEMGVLGRG